MTSGCLDRKEVRGAIWGVHSTTDRPAGGNTGRLFLAFGGPVCADRISNCPLDRVLTYKNLIYLLNLQVPPFHSSVFKSAKHFGHSFAFDALKIWNDLPQDVRSATSVASFRKKLKTYLFAKAYPP